MPSTDLPQHAAGWPGLIAAAYPHNVLSPGAYAPGTLEPFPGALNDLEGGVAYAVAAATLQQVTAATGTRIAGYKISVASKRDQDSINATEPVLGAFTTEQILGDGAVIDLAAANQPLLEPEVAMRTTAELGADATIEQIAASVELAAAIEVPTSRFAGWLPAEGPGVIGVGGLIADNAVAGVVVTGDNWIAGISPERMRSLAVELVTPDGTVVPGFALNVIDGPYAAMQWLLRKLDSLGRTLPVGAVVSSGTLAPPTRVVAGTYTARFDSGLGSASVRFD
jgi:2-keto-4-pentenoate hydratase